MTNPPIETIRIYVYPNMLPVEVIFRNDLRGFNERYMVDKWTVKSEQRDLFARINRSERKAIGIRQRRLCR